MQPAEYIPSGHKENEIYKAPPLDDFEMDQFARLIAQESHTPEGQKDMMGLIETMVQERRQRRESHIRNRLIGSGKSVDNLAPILRSEMSRVVSYTGNVVPDGRYNVIVEIGEPLKFLDDQSDRDAMREEETTIAIISHSDTVIPTTDDQMELRIDQNNEDLVTGRGVWDEKQAVLNNLWYVENIDPPPGMRVYLIFTFDEEDTSLGAKTLVKNWRRWPTVDVVYSHEIGPNTAVQNEEGEEVHTLHPARRGRAKYEFKASLPSDRLDHGAGSVGQVGVAVADMVHMLMRQYPMKAKKGHFLQSRSDLLGSETLELPQGNWSQSQPGYGVSDTGSAQFNIALIPPSDRKTLEEQLHEKVVELAKKEGWDKLGIHWELYMRKDVTSYDGYELSEGRDHPLTAITSAIIEQVSGLIPDIIGADSVADECIYAGTILGNKDKCAKKPYVGVISHPPKGGNAHGDSEWVSMESIRAIRSVAMNLIQHEDGFKQWISDKAKKAE